MTEENTPQESALSEQALPVGTTLAGDQFTITDFLGAGGFGITYRAMDNVLGRTIVIKECFPEDFCFREGRNAKPRSRNYAKPVRSIVSMFMREARSLAKLRHPNIVGVHRAFEENETAYMVLDLIEGRDLFDILDAGAPALSPARVRDILIQMLDAVEKVHELDLLHRDISPDNILIENTGTPVLIDFGAARAESSRHTRAVSAMLVVKDGYSPQEFYTAGSHQAPCSDLYALAATFYHVLSGEAPPNSQTRLVEIAGQNPDPCVPLAGRIEGYDRAFLEAIDTAMSIHPDARLQSAAKWRSLISGGAGEAPSTEARATTKDVSLELELSLTQLVAETNDEVRKTSETVVEAVAPPKPPDPPRKPAWIEEFNEETFAPPPRPEPESEDARDDFWREAAFDAIGEGDPDAAEQAPARRTSSETNWIHRAVEKQERLQSERERQWELYEAGETKVAREVASHEAPAATDEIDDAATVAGDQSHSHQFKIILALFVGVLFLFYLNNM